MGLVSKTCFALVIVLVSFFFAIDLVPPSMPYHRLEVIPETAVQIDNDLYDAPEFAQNWYTQEGQTYELRVLTSSIRIPYILNLLDEKFDSKQSITLASLGCGGGLVENTLAEKLLEQNRSVSIRAFDLSERSVQEATKRIPSSVSKSKQISVSFTQASIYQVPLKNSSVDVIIVLDVLEHLLNLPLALQEMSRILKPNGFVVFETVDRNWKSYLLVIRLAEWLQMIPRHTHDYRLFIRPEEMKQGFASVQMQILHLQSNEMRFHFDHWKEIFNPEWNISNWLRRILKPTVDEFVAAPMHPWFTDSYIGTAQKVK